MIAVHERCVRSTWSLQAVIDANIIPALIDVMGRAEFKTRKEAAWAITNAVSGGSADQIRFLVDQGRIPPLCNLLTVMDPKIVQVALNGLEHVLRAGMQDSKVHGGMNHYAVTIEECYGLCSLSLSFLSLSVFSRHFYGRFPGGPGEVFFYIFFPLSHCTLASCGAVYCNRSCVCVWVLCMWLCYHDSSKLHASILTKLGL